MSRAITFTCVPLLLFWWRVPLLPSIVVLGLMLLVSWRIRRAARTLEELQSTVRHLPNCRCTRCDNEMYQRDGRHR